MSRISVTRAFGVPFLLTTLFFLSLTSASPLPTTTYSTTPTSPPAYPLPLPCTGEGCTFTTYSIQDSAIIPHTNGTLFRFSKSTEAGTGLTLSTSPSISGPWTRQPNVLIPTSPNVHLLDPLDTHNDSTVQQWAPEAHYIGGTYYLFYSIAQSAEAPYLDIAFASSPNMSTGSWTDHGSVGIPEPTAHKWANIDLNLLVDFSTSSSSAYSNGAVDSSYHFAFGSYNNGLYGGSLTSPSSAKPLTLAAGTTPQLLITDQLTPTPSDTGALSGNRSEASFHFKHGGYVYFFFSRGNCCSYSTDAIPGTEYVTQVCRSTSATGPFVDRAGLSCTGASNGAGTTVLASHSQNAAGKYEVFAPGSVGVLVRRARCCAFWIHRSC